MLRPYSGRLFSEQNVWNARELADRAEILAYLETDRLYAAYAIGDLEPGFFEDCTWAGAERAGCLRALALHYRGLDPPPLLLMGEPGGLRAVLAGQLCPERVHLTCRPEHLPTTQAFYAWQQTVPMWRMALRPGRFRPVPAGGATPPDQDCLRLTTAHADQLAALYAWGGGPAFSPSQVAQGLFYGIMVEDLLVSVAGTHLVSHTYGLAAVGNVFTHPGHRGRGHGTATTSAVVGSLLAAGIGDVVLNVGQDNAAAIHVYERLGFERICPFFEGPAFSLEHSAGLERPKRLV
jgi:ribosomal protein S18 acetylase RimI-like enzyme